MKKIPALDKFRFPAVSPLRFPFPIYSLPPSASPYPGPTPGNVPAYPIPLAGDIDNRPPWCCGELIGRIDGDTVAWERIGGWCKDGMLTKEGNLIRWGENLLCLYPIPREDTLYLWPYRLDLPKPIPHP
jgi:hypothetical protein